MPSVLATVLAALVPLAAAAITSGVYPMNSTRTPNSTLVSPITLTLEDGQGTTMFSLQPAFNTLDPTQPWVSVFSSSISDAGVGFLMTPQNYQAWDHGLFGFVSCDPEDYIGNIDLQTMLNNAAANLNSGGSGTWVMVFYSRYSEWCCMTGTSPFGTLPYVFTTTSPTAARSVTDMLIQSSRAETAIIANQIASNSSGSPSPSSTASASGSNATGASPTTTVAMIILYSITGLITLGFVFIIVTGSVRAHRHPERYNQRNANGGTAHSRARGIARAMLDGIPIVKFGEAESNKRAEPGIELESGLQRSGSEAADTAAPVAEATDTEGPTEITTEDGAAVPAASEEDIDGIRPAVEPTTATTDAQAEAGLACSVCTDDFVRGQDTRVLPCNHKFHPECIDPWLLNVSGTCPLCRVDLNPPATSTSAHSPNESPISVTVSSVAEGPIYVATGLNNVYRRVDAASRRSSANVFTAWHRASLNRQRMRDATPQERVMMLRELRLASREGAGLSASGPAGGGLVVGTGSRAGSESRIGSIVATTSDASNGGDGGSDAQTDSGRSRLSRLFKRQSRQPTIDEPGPPAESEDPVTVPAETSTAAAAELTGAEPTDAEPTVAAAGEASETQRSAETREGGSAASQRTNGGAEEGEDPDVQAAATETAATAESSTAPTQQQETGEKTESTVEDKKQEPEA